VPADITTAATSPAGAVVTFSASASDLVDQGPDPTACRPREHLPGRDHDRHLHGDRCRRQHRHGDLRRERRSSAGLVDRGSDRSWHGWVLSLYRPLDRRGGRAVRHAPRPRAPTSHFVITGADRP
jgi:hypothetical protein